jgi:beta-mannosidase
MRDQLDLNGVWQVTWTEGLHGRVEHAAGPEQDPRRYLDVQVPGELHRELQRLGLLDDPNLGLNTLKARWVEEQMWGYRRTFEAPADALDRPAWLCFDGLDLAAVIYLNGEEVGRHKSAHRPCRIPVTGKLLPGANTLAISLESGLYDVADRPGADYNTAPETLLNKRHWMRKAQYQAGWDWNPRLINVGITGDVRLEWSDQPWVEHVAALPSLSDDLARAELTVRAFVHNPAAEPVTARLQVMVAAPGGEHVYHAAAEAELPPGESMVQAVAHVHDPALWWPVGQGAQPLYAVVAALEVAGQLISEGRTETGLRKIALDRGPHPAGGEYFILRVNNRPIFCKGGNWVPPDMIVPGVEDERYARLVDLAVESNCNLLRIWGGGYYVNRALLEACDRAGVLLWNDLAFACSKYPGDDPAFMAEVREEVTWNVRRMASHPSLVVWCGNNELEWGAWGWGYASQGRALPDYSLFHHVIPVILKAEDPSRPYWPSSPYSADHVFPNDPTTGDQHPWDVTLGPHGTNFRAYRTFVDRFPNEGGVLGATSPATLRQCLGDGFAFRSPAWEHHDNAANFWAPTEGVTYKTVRDWLGLDPAQMDLEAYCFASGLLQAEGLKEYIDNYRRRMFSSSSAIFWMYNDSWPATHGWTIVDYYLRRKLAYHPVRRAFQPVSVVVAEEGDRLLVVGVNDSPDAWEGVLRWGVARLVGGTPADETQTVALPANAATLLGELDRTVLEAAGINDALAFAALSRDDALVAQHRLLLGRYADLTLPAPAVQVTRAGDTAVFRSEGFVWGVCVDMDGEAPVADNLFDLLPGVDYPVPWPATLGEPAVLRTGSDLVRR